MLAVAGSYTKAHAVIPPPFPVLQLYLVLQLTITSIYFRNRLIRLSRLSSNVYFGDDDCFVVGLPHRDLLKISAQWFLRSDN